MKAIVYGTSKCSWCDKVANMLGDNEIEVVKKEKKKKTKHVYCVVREQIIQVKTLLNTDMVMQRELANSVLGVVILADTEKKIELIDRDTKIFVFCMIVAIVIGAITGKILAMNYL